MSMTQQEENGQEYNGMLITFSNLVLETIDRKTSSQNIAAIFLKIYRKKRRKREKPSEIRRLIGPSPVTVFREHLRDRLGGSSRFPDSINFDQLFDKTSIRFSQNGRC
mgnify:CR=1 FL=1